MTAEVAVWLTVDFTAKRYGVLPSQLIKEGDTLDLDCANIAVAYEEYVRKNPGVKTDHGFTQQQLLEQMEAVRREKNNARKS